MNITVPLVSVIVCCRNENDYIENCLNSLISQKKVNESFEILVIDGMSTDGTREIIVKMIEKFSNIRLLDNPAKVKPQAINLGFKEAKGEHLLICDAHAVYDQYYISTCLELIKEHPDAWCVGGPFTNVGETNFGKALAIAMNSPLGVGNAKHRYPDYEGYGEMVMFGLFPRFVLEKVGYYDEFFVINHDDEYCFRLRKMGGNVFLSYKAKCYYFVRKTPMALFKQYFSYGLWQIAFLKKHKEPISFRQLVPFIFFVFVFFLLIYGILLNNGLIALIVPSIYLLVLSIFSIPVLIKENLRVAINFPLSIFILHFSYAVGFVAGMIKFQNKNFSSF